MLPAAASVVPIALKTIDGCGVILERRVFHFDVSDSRKDWSFEDLLLGGCREIVVTCVMLSRPRSVLRI